MDQAQAPSGGRVRHRRLYLARRQPQIFRRFDCRIPRSGWTPFRWPSRNWFLRKGLGARLRPAPKNQTGDVPFCELARKKTREMEPRHHPCSHETLPLGRTGAGRLVKFTEWTLDDQLRQPVFLGLRTINRQSTSFVNSSALREGWRRGALSGACIIAGQISSKEKRQRKKDFGSIGQNDGLIALTLAGRTRSFETEPATRLACVAEASCSSIGAWQHRDSSTEAKDVRP
jgi:hypothetical protein